MIGSSASIYEAERSLIDFFASCQLMSYSKERLKESSADVFMDLVEILLMVTY